MLALTSKTHGMLRFLKPHGLTFSNRAKFAADNDKNEVVKDSRPKESIYDLNVAQNYVNGNIKQLIHSLNLLITIKT